VQCAPTPRGDSADGSPLQYLVLDRLLGVTRRLMAPRPRARMPAALQDVAYNQRPGFFDFIPHIMTGLIRELISWHISDVAPLWAVFASRQEAVSVGRVA
jgi:hypothetical protein